MLAFPNAKINLGLHVISKRTDGYHNLETVFYPVNIKDALEINDAKETNCKIAGITIPGNVEENICLKAFYLLRQDYQFPPQAITLLKKIPVGAGLGGGSSDAAFLLSLLNEKFNLGLTNKQLIGYARQLGADCAFFIENAPVFAYARGDEFESLSVDLSSYFMVLVKPPIHVSTQDAYGGVIPGKPEYTLRTAISQPVSDWKDCLVNDFERNIFVKYPLIKALKDDLYAQGAIFAQMSGSGSSVYGIFDHPVTLQFPEDYTVFYNI